MKIILAASAKDAHAFAALKGWDRSEWFFPLDERHALSVDGAEICLAPGWDENTRAREFVQALGGLLVTKT